MRNWVLSFINLNLAKNGFKKKTLKEDLLFQKWRPFLHRNFKKVFKLTVMAKKKKIYRSFVTSVNQSWWRSRQLLRQPDRDTVLKPKKLSTVIHASVGRNSILTPRRKSVFSCFLVRPRGCKMLSRCRNVLTLCYYLLFSLEQYSVKI